MKSENKGFTMLEMLFAFFIFMFLTGLLMPILKLSASFLDNEGVAIRETEIFFGQLGREVREADDTEVQAGTLLMLSPTGKLVTYEQYGTMIRRRVDGKGHELVLQNITAVRFVEVPNGINVSVTKAGKTLERRISRPYGRDSGG
ncbi:competence type IV pilus minor pilin ComGF [Bacillus marinisedimentorum]|uniref:competence type IV pilus minor pilin ComGF n=1 Tax=Bacillus marinisedimentorum TaxID=1821260 RepID=UPI000871E4E0|nr:competence type IV pilus minor pilin ComGF [Bacillus marinisedimentorum]